MRSQLCRINECKDCSFLLSVAALEECYKAAAGGWRLAFGVSAPAALTVISVVRSVTASLSDCEKMDPHKNESSLELEQSTCHDCSGLVGQRSDFGQP